MRKILYIVHNHPTIRPGGAEAYALELYQTMRTSDRFDPVLVARTGPGGSLQPVLHAGAPFSAVGDDPNQYFVYTETEGYDFFLETYRDKALYTTYFAAFLRSFNPEIVHFQHTQFIGNDLITFIHRTLPNVPLIYTLHEFLPICHRDGQFVRTLREELCSEASPRRCNECFPEWTPQYFFLRERLIKSHLSHVDLFLAPSKFLLERYVDWGIPREKLRFEDYGRIPQRPLEAPPVARARTRLGFFGQLNPYKGVDVLLGAMKLLLTEAPDVHLFLHGANLDVLREEQRSVVVDALESSGANVTFTGPYDSADVPRLMSEIDWVVVPSRWWENSPLVIQEAFMHCRPVICSDIGGMAEKVTNGVDGLHFRVGSPADLAEKIRVAVSSPGLWERLCDQIPSIYGMDEHVASLGRIYDDLIEQRMMPQSDARELAPRAG